ncbi:hypothetical protein TNCV_4629491 [Trichonephila clavipes]|nr:hypothetical protein TNCV_4629491 [Trichonephila clavipes]
MVIRSEGAVEYVMVGVSRRPTQAIWRGKEIEPVQVIVMRFDPVKIVVASELQQFEFNGIEITGFTCDNTFRLSCTSTLRDDTLWVVREPPISLLLSPPSRKGLRLDDYLECPHAAQTLNEV